MFVFCKLWAVIVFTLTCVMVYFSKKAHSDKNKETDSNGGDRKNELLQAKTGNIKDLK